MKKIIALLVSALFFGFAFANMTSSQQKNVEYVADFLIENGTLIDQRAGESQEKQLMAQELRKNLVGELNTVDDYNEFQSLLLLYVQGLNEIKEGRTDSVLVELTQPTQATLSLQNNIRKQLNQGQDLERPLQESTTLAMTLDAMIPFVGKVDGMWNIVGDSRVDMSRQIMESLLAMDMGYSLNSSPDGVEESLNAKGLLDIKMPGNDMMYIGMKESEIGGTESEDEMVAFIVDQMQDVLKNTYISIPLEGGDDLGMINIDTIATRYTLSQSIKEKPFLRFYHQEGNSYYGFFSHDLCDLLETIGVNEREVKECHEGIDSVLAESNGKGPIVLTMNNGTYDLSLNNYDGHMPAYLEGVDIVSRNAQRVTKVSLPFDEIGNGISYKGSERKVTVNDDEVDVNLSVESDNGMTKIDGTIQADGMVIEIDGEFNHSGEKTAGSLEIAVSQGDVSLGKFTLDLDTQIKNITPFEVQVPTNTMTMDEFSDIMEQRMMEFYLQ